MGTGVEYRVSTIYEARDNASKNLREIGGAAKDAARNTTSLLDSLKGVALAVGAFAGFGRAKSLLIDYNAELEQSKTVIAGMLTLYTGQDINKTWDRAAISVERFQEMAKKSSLTTKELVATAQGLTRPLIQVGVKMTDIEKITFGVANAAKAFGMSGEVVSMDVEQALRGGVSERDRFIKSMLAQKGIELSADKFNKKSQADRIDILKKALTSPAISAMADKQAGTMSGQFSTLQDNIQIAFGKIGLPLVKAITDEVKGWNEWIDANGSKLGEMGKSFSSAIMFGFKTVKQVVSEMWPIIQSVGGVIKDLIVFAANHKDTLIGLAKALIVLKVGEKLGGMARGAAGGVGGFLGGAGGSWGSIKEGITGLKDGTGSLKNAFTSIGSVLVGAGGLIGAFAKLATLGYAIGGFMMRDTEKEKKENSVAQGQVLAAGLYGTTRQQIQQLETRLGKVGYREGQDITVHGYAARADIERLTKMKADVAMTESRLIEEGMKAGIVREEVTGFGTRKLEMLGAGDPSSSLSNYKEVYAAQGQLVDQLTILFKEKANQAQLEFGNLMSSGRDTSAGGFHEGTRQGFFTERVLSQKDGFSEETQSKPANQTINITIQRVMAKDPNRWLADMDDMVKQRQRAPTRARDAWRSSPK